MNTIMNTTRLHKWIIVLVLALGLAVTSTANAAAVNTPMTENLDANDFDIFDIDNLSATNCTASGTQAVAVGVHTIASGTGSLAYGWTYGDPSNNIIASGIGALAGGRAEYEGFNVTAAGDGSFATGFSDQGSILANADGAVAIGVAEEGGIHAYGIGSVAIGHAEALNIDATGSGAVAIGYASAANVEANGDGSVALGEDITANADNAIAIGKSFTNGTASSFAVGFGAKDFAVESGKVTVNGDLHVTGNVTADGNCCSGGGTKRVFFPMVDSNYNLNYLRARSMAGTGSCRFTFYVPSDFSSLVSLDLVGQVSAGAAGASKNIDLSTNYGAVGEASNANSESDTASTYDLSSYSNKLYELDLSGVFTGIAAGDFCGVYVDHKTIGGYIYYVGIVMEYN